jgi:tRNA(Ile)-lysidine synthase
VRIAEAKAVSASETKTLFSDLQTIPVIMLAVSGGPDSTALMVLAARWRDTLKTKPKLIAVTVDHGLRKESRQEATAVARLARKFKIAHRTLRWRGRKPATGLQQAARSARYRLLGEAARKEKAAHILTAHTLDDQAETVLIRMSRGSGLTGLGAMSRLSGLPHDGARAITLVRPLLDIPKARLIATLRATEIPYADDPSNRDPRFTRARVRAMMSALAEEGLDASRLAQLARRLKRAESAIEAAVDRAADGLLADLPSSVVIERRRFAELPAEIALRLLARALTRAGDEGPVELGKLEALKNALDDAQNAGNGRFRRTLAGAVVTLTDRQLIVERAPPRRRRKLLTTRRAARASRAKTR